MSPSDDEECIQSDSFQAGGVKQRHIQASPQLLSQDGIGEPDALPVLLKASRDSAVNNLLFRDSRVDGGHLLPYPVRSTALVFVGESVASASHEELEKAYDSTLNKVNDREVVDGTVIAMNKREVVVNIGYKSDGIIPLSEFRYNPDLKIGDTVEVYIENQEDKKGQLVLSHRKARATRSWDRVNAALENEEIIKGYIKCRTKGGMIVDVFGIEAFLPGSQIDVKPIRDYDVFVGKTMEFKWLKSTRNSRMWLFPTKLLSKLNLNSRRRKLSVNLKKDKYLKVLLKISHLTVYLSTLAA